jgi:hypothetical protein
MAAFQRPIGQGIFIELVAASNARGSREDSEVFVYRAPNGIFVPGDDRRRNTKEGPPLSGHPDDRDCGHAHRGTRQC